MDCFEIRKCDVVPTMKEKLRGKLGQIWRESELK